PAASSSRLAFTKLNVRLTPGSDVGSYHQSRVIGETNVSPRVPKPRYLFDTMQSLFVAIARARRTFSSQRAGSSLPLTLLLHSCVKPISFQYWVLSSEVWRSMFGVPARAR